MIDKDIVILQLESLNTRLDKVDNQFEKLFDAQSEMNVILTRNTVTVEQHHRRSTLMERIMAKYHKRLDILEKDLLSIKSDVAMVAAELGPVKAHVTEVSKMVHFISGLPPVVKFFAGLLTVATMGYGVFEILKKIIETSSVK